MRTAFVALFLFPCLGTAAQENAAEKWMPEILTAEGAQKHYLPDWSYAGYHWGEKAIPEHEPTMHVRDFGAVPDDDQDDTEAFQKALAAAHEKKGRVVLQMAPGKYIIRQILQINRSDFVLQGSGSGPGGTLLWMPDPMKKMELPEEEFVWLRKFIRDYQKNTPDGKAFSLFSWTGGIIWARVPGRPEPKEVTKITGGRRGEHAFTVEDASKIRPGSDVRVNWHNREGENSSLLHHVFGTKGLKWGTFLADDHGFAIVRQEVRAERVEGNTVTIKEPLLHDLRPEWAPTVTTWERLTEVGLEHFRVEFPETLYPGHHLEEGYNAIYLDDLGHSWARDLSFNHADTAIAIQNSHNVTAELLQVDGRLAHYTMQLAVCYNVLVKDFWFRGSAVHTPSFNTMTKSCVYTRGVVMHPRLDQHNGVNHQNLFDFLTVHGDVPQIFWHGGSANWGPCHGAFNTWWNIRLAFSNEGPLNLGGIHDGPHVRIVGLHGECPLEFTYGPDAYIEGTNRKGITVPSIYEHQLRKRLGRR